jgi:hypothetical protein
MTPERWIKIEAAIWIVEIELDSATCLDGGEDEETKEKAERYLAQATTLRKRLIAAFAPGGKPSYQIEYEKRQANAAVQDLQSRNHVSTGNHTHV